MTSRVFFTFFLLSLALAGCVRTPAPEPLRLGDVVLTGDTLWQGEVVIDGTVKVAKQARLTVAPGSDIRFVRRDLDQDGLGDATLIVEGELRAVGSPAAPVRFRSAEDEPQPGDWLEIRVDFSRNAELRWCEIRDSAHTLHAHFTKGVLEDSHIHHNIDGTRLGEARFAIRHNLIEDNLGKGINFRNATVEIAHNVIRRNRAGLFLFETDRESRIHHNNFVANGDNLRLGDFFTGEVQVADNWWGTADPTAAAASVYDRKADPAIGSVHLAPATAWLRDAGPRRAAELSERWAFATGGFVDSPAFLAAGRLFIPSWDGALYALGPADGRALWQHPLGDIADAAPVEADGRLFVQDWSRSVRALATEDGRELWRFVYPASPADDHRQGGLAAHGDAVLVPAWNGTLYALAAADGTLRWTFATAGPLRARPLVTPGQLVLASEDGALYGLGAEGTQRWRFETGSPLRAAPVALEGGAVAVNRAGKVVALTGDGSLRWSRDLDEECFYAAPLVADGAVFVATAAGALWKLDAASGETLWRVDVGSPLFATPVAVHGTAVFGDNCGRLHVVDLVSGAALGSFSSGDAIQSPVSVLDGLLLFGSRDGRVRALELQLSAAGEGR